MTKKSQLGRQILAGSECFERLRQRHGFFYSTVALIARVTVMKKAAAREALINYLKNPDPDAVVTLKDGVTWVAQLQPFYWELLGVSHQTLRDIISEPPFVRKPKILGATIVKDGDNTKLEGGKKFCLLRVLADGEAPPQRDYADEAKRVMIKVWTTSDVIDEDHKRLNAKQISCLWGMAGDIIKLLDDRRPNRAWRWPSRSSSMP
jgi:hypothetical protein